MLRISDVVKVDYERKRIRKEIYTRIYEQFCRKIKQSTEMGYKHTILTVPSYVFGYPTFDRYMAVDYLFRQFSLGGFDVHIIDPYSIYVSWLVQKKKSVPDRETETEPKPSSEPDILEDFPTLINLKKAADKYRKNKKRA
ncbi:hypothetical protein [Dishui Lake phycodnavirus 4]|nr:hypothetical protein [Dishui Lake phycodnavirus 4]